MNVFVLREDKSENDKYDTEELRSELSILKKALKSFDAGTINKSVETLGNIVRSGSVKNQILDISDKILVGEYEEAMDIIEKLLKDGN
jgi:hypothetical protein